MKSIIFNNNEFVLFETGILFWPKWSVYIVSDLHLEKSSFYAKHGIMLPPYDSIETLKKLEKSLNRKKANKLILLGDVFHDSEGYQRLNDKAKRVFNKITEKYNTVFVFGNHDKELDIPNVKKCSTHLIDSISFSHEPSKSSLHEVCGHFHPKFQLRISGRNISKNCFIVTEKRICLPNFGVFSGGLNVKSEIFDNFLDRKRDYYLIDEKNVYKI